MAVKPLPNRQKESPSSRRLATFGHRVLAASTTIFVVCLIAASLTVSAMAISDRLKTAKAISQILDLVDLTRRVANNQLAFGTNGHEDILLRLSNMEQLRTTGDNGNNYKTINNPWDGKIIAYTNPDNQFRIETSIPSRFCSRIIGVLGTNVNSLNLREIETKGSTQFWLQIHNPENHVRLNQSSINVGCSSAESIILALTFALR